MERVSRQIEEDRGNLVKPGKNYLFAGVEQELAEYLEPVSYTHLDVYKRQGLKGPVSASAYGDERSGRFCECFCSGGYYPRCEGC